MPQLHRMNDSNEAGGMINFIPQSTVYCNGLLVCVDGSKGTSHAPDVPPHTEGDWETSGGSPSVRVEGLPVNSQGDVDTCGDARAAGSSDTYVGG